MLGLLLPQRIDNDYRGQKIALVLFALLGLEQLGGKLIHRLLTVTTNAHAPGGIVTLVVYGLTIVGLGLSLWRRGSPQPPA